jgi:uncharacterized membrane protein
MKEKLSGNLFYRSSLKLFFAFLPSLILLMIFFSNKLFLQNNISSGSFAETLKALFFISPIITLQYFPENIYSVVILLLIILLFFSGVIYNRQAFKNDNAGQKVFYKRPAFWGIVSFLMLILFFLIPDKAATGGVIKFRLELFFFLFMILFITTLPSRQILYKAVLVIIPIWMILKFFYLFPKMESLDADVKETMKITEIIEADKILLPLNYSTNWMHHNLFNYAGTVKNILVLDNYEAGMPHFPLIWKSDKNPVSIIGSFNGTPPLCADINKFEKLTCYHVDYIVVWHYEGLTDTCSSSIQSVLNSGYRLVYQKNNYLKLFRRRDSP